MSKVDCTVGTRTEGFGEEDGVVANFLLGDSGEVRGGCAQRRGKRVGGRTGN